MAGPQVAGSPELSALVAAVLAEIDAQRGRSPSHADTLRGPNLSRVSVDLSAAGTVVVARAVRSVYIAEMGIEGNHYLEIDGPNGRFSQRIPAVAGTIIEDLPMAEVRFVSGGGGADTNDIAVIFCSTNPGGIPRKLAYPADWQVFSDESSLVAGNATATIQLPDGFEYEINTIVSVVVSDATAVSRVPQLSWWGRHGDAVDFRCAADSVSASQTQATVWGWGAGVNRISVSPSHEGRPFPQLLFRVTEASGAQLRLICASGGQAGDTIQFFLFGKRRRISTVAG